MVVAELGGLGPVEQHRPRRGVYGISLGSGPGHLIICLAVTGRRARWSCTVGVMGERRGWVSARMGGRGRGGETARQRQRTEDRDTGGRRASQPDCVPARLLYADEQRVDSVTFLVEKKNSPSPLSAVLWRYRQHARMHTRTLRHALGTPRV